jgi:2-C-methyl-D-erythritol 4-phosphate cytidylyltransferase
MNIALLIAGGSGNRMGQDIPKHACRWSSYYHSDNAMFSTTS